MCDCEMPDYDDEEGEYLYDDKEVVADKSLVCCECSHPIGVGTIYKYIRGCWDGDWQVFATCLTCVALGDRFAKETDCCYPFGGLYDELIDSDFLCRDEDEIWIEQVSWLTILCQEPLKCEVVEATP
ncbi:hypothetical protein I8748_31865 [Nostoc sp. CENA67]|uniref:Uncharacterized protein n=1 Tax=Amazonocrinis nigriterrae CENA67 TaxID=2794033 RepID=A0A8J7HVN7_9NOST|nr:hypothetical protein [Amazonocrinis nigriterrae]MBH8566696.1 hypothetical protein [Amazonocrinis nigriterrae CENA67]